MKFNTTTYIIALITLGLYSIYIMVTTGIAGVILSLAAGLIAAAFVNTFEIITASIVIVGVLYVLIVRWLSTRRREGFSDGTPKEISARVIGIENKYKPKAEPTGVFDTDIEGFEDVSQQPKEGAPSSSTSASTATATQPPPIADAMMKAVTSANSDGAKPEEKKEQFSSNQGGLFKIGEIPSESADGPHIDAAGTLMKAMNSLKPDQITQMTNDTKSLLETQQNLMSMLKTMGPVLQDGRKLLDSFSGIFGGAGPSGGEFKLGGGSA